MNTSMDIPIKVLSVRQPWAHAIIHGTGQGWKDVENRSWSTAYHGPLFIHAGLSKSEMPIAKDIGYAGDEPFCFGRIIGVVDLLDCVDSEVPPGPQVYGESQWAGWGSDYYWLLSNPRPLDDPIPCKGALGLFTPSDSEIVRKLRHILAPKI